MQSVDHGGLKRVQKKILETPHGYGDLLHRFKTVRTWDL